MVFAILAPVSSLFAVGTYLNVIMDSKRTIKCAMSDCFALEACWEVELCSDGREFLLITLDCWRRRRKPRSRFLVAGGGWKRRKCPVSRILTGGRDWRRWRNPRDGFLRRRGILNEDWLGC